VQVLISRHESKKKNKEKVQKGNSLRRVKGAKGEQCHRAPKVTRPQLAKGDPKASTSQRRLEGELQRQAIPESTKSYSPSTRQRRPKSEHFAKANRSRAPKASNSQRASKVTHPQLAKGEPKASNSQWRVIVLARRVRAA